MGRYDQPGNPFEGINRDHWAKAFAAVFINSQDVEVLHRIKAAGFGEFEIWCRKYLHGHMFKQEDYRKIYEIICHTATLNPLDRRAFVNKQILSLQRHHKS